MTMPMPQSIQATDVADNDGICGYGESESQIKTQIRRK